jgi:hypothetical protein
MVAPLEIVAPLEMVAPLEIVAPMFHVKLLTLTRCLLCLIRWTFII